ncbi:MAG: sodium:solute symporter family protein [Candidatus Latescibacterota bacterium]
MNFSWIDWLIIVVYLGATISVGLYAKKFVSDLSGYLVAGRRIRVGLGTSTLIATELGTVTIMYMAQNGYQNGFAAMVFGIIILIAYMLVGRTGFIIEGLRKLRVMTIPEFYEIRYSRPVRIIGGLLLFLGGTLNMGIFLKLDGVFLSHAMGFGDSAVAVIMVIMLIVVGLYTMFGGMLSVIFTDYMQFAVMTLGMLLTTIFAFRAVSLHQVAQAVTTSLGSSGFNPFTNGNLGWSFIFWMLLSNFAAASLWAPGVARALSAESPKTGKRVYTISSLTFAGRAIIPMFWGVVALSLYPGLTGEDSMSAMPRMLGAILPTGVLGILIAGMLAASMSTYSSYLLAWASVITRDVIALLFGGRLSEKTIMNITRVWVALIGVYLVLFGLLYTMPDIALKYVYITGNIYTAGALSAIGFGLYWRKANNVGAYAALITGAIAPIAFLLLSGIKSSLPPSLIWLTNPNFSGFASFALGAAGMIVGSLLTQKSNPPIDITHLLKEGR